MTIAWSSMVPPLPAVAVAAQGIVGDCLAARAAVTDAKWELVRWLQWALVAGEDLPWVDGVTYLGVLPGTSDILVPVHRRPRLHPDLLVKAVRSLAPASSGRVAIIPHDGDRIAVLLLKGRQ